MQDRPVLYLGQYGVVKMAATNRLVGRGVGAIPFLDDQIRYPTWSDASW